MERSTCRLTVFVCSLIILSPMLSAHGQDRAKQRQQPTVVFSLKSVDELLQDADFIGATVGQDGLKDHAENFLNGVTGGSGLAGVDRSRPLGLYWDMQSPDPGNLGMPVVFLPISDPAAFKKLISGLLPNLKDSDGEWSVNIGEMTLFAKIANKNCYISPSADELDDLAIPDKIVNMKYDIAIEVNLAGIPDQAKATFLEETEKRGRESMDNSPAPASEAEAKGQELGFDWMLALITSMTYDGDRMTFGVDVNRQSQLTGMDFGISGKPDSPLAKSLAEFGKTVPLLSGAASDSAPFRLVISLPTTAVLANLDDLFAAMTKSADNEIDKDEKLEDDDDRNAAKNVAHRLFDIGEATLKSGSIHSVITLEKANDNSVRVVAGAKVSDGSEAAKLLDDILKLAKESPELAKFKPDVANVSGARIHEIGLDLDDNQTKMFGESAGHLAFRTDSLWFSLGGENLDVLKKSLVLSAAPPRKPGAPISLRTKPATLITLFEKNDRGLIERAQLIAGKPGDVFNIEVAPTSAGAKLRAEFGIDLLKLANDNR